MVQPRAMDPRGTLHEEHPQLRGLRFYAVFRIISQKRRRYNNGLGAVIQSLVRHVASLQRGERHGEEAG